MTLTREQIEAIIRDLENRLKLAEAEVNRTDSSKVNKDILENFFSSGVVASLHYTINELKKLTKEG